MWKKRYSWEGVSKSEWRHYLDKLDAFFVFLEETEDTARELARKKGRYESELGIVDQPSRRRRRPACIAESKFKNGFNGLGRDSLKRRITQS
ncbi:MAG: hypothetical protein OXG96_17815, partial [Acidobacteria bacterium]|nr:hypothetical protein [Acidobacteriota bacterium]